MQDPRLLRLHLRIERSLGWKHVAGPVRRAVTVVAVVFRDLLADGHGWSAEWHLVALLVLRALRQQRPDVAGYLAAAHTDYLAASLAGQQHQLDGGTCRAADGVAGKPELLHFLVVENALARVLLGWRLEASAR